MKSRWDFNLESGSFQWGRYEDKAAHIQVAYIGVSNIMLVGYVLRLQSSG